jgi:hypothetical protein
VVIHKASKQRRDDQLRAYFSNLPKDSNGRLTKQGREARDGWLRQQQLSLEMARRITKGIPTGEATEVTWEEWLEATKETP